MSTASKSPSASPSSSEPNTCGARLGGDLLGLGAVGVNGRRDLDARGVLFDAVQVIRRNRAAPDKGQLECLGHVYPPSAISKRSAIVSLTL